MNLPNLKFNNLRLRAASLNEKIRWARISTAEKSEPMRRAVLDPLYREAAEVQVELLELILEIFDSRGNSLKLEEHFNAGCGLGARVSDPLKGSDHIFDAMRYLMPDWLKKAQSVGRDERKPYRGPHGPATCQESQNETVINKTNMNKNSTTCNAGNQGYAASASWAKDQCPTNTSNMDRHLAAFKSVIEALYFAGENLVITGSFALQAAGLQMNRPQRDLNITIYGPTDQQIDQLKLLESLAQKSEDGRIYRFEVGGAVLVISLVSNELAPEKPLLYMFENRLYRISPIYRVIECKKRHILNEVCSHKHYTDLQELKNLNFNL